MVKLSPIGRLACWRRRMDTAYRPDAEPEDVVPTDTAPQGLEVILEPVRMQRSLLAATLQRPLYVPSWRGVRVDAVNGEKVSWIFHCLVVDCHWWLEHLGHFFGQMLPCAWYHLTQRCILFWEISPKGTNFDHVRRLAPQGLVAGVLTGPVRHGRRRDICKILIVPVPGPSDPQNFHGVCQSAPGRS